MGRIKIGAWYPIDLNYLDKRHIDEIKESGIDLIFAGWGDKEQQKEIFNLCNNAGIGVLIGDHRVMKCSGDSAEIKSYISDYINEPSFVGNMLCDEPNAAAYPALGKRVTEYKKAVCGKIPYINLFPIYASLEMLGTSSYEEYVEEFAKQIDTDYISVDIYPFSMGEDNIKRTGGNYFRNLDIIAKICRKYNRSMYGFIQTMGFNYVMRPPTEDEMRYQAYAYLAFGAEHIYHFCYATPPSSNEHFEYAMIDLNGEKTDLWYSAKAVNDELHAISDIYSNYKNVGTYINITGETPDGVDFENIYDINSLGIIKNFSSDGAVLAGCMKKIDGEGIALILLNCNEVRDEKSVNVSFSLESKKTVTSYIKGNPLTADIDSDVCNITLDSCGGALIVIE